MWVRLWWPSIVVEDVVRDGMSMLCVLHTQVCVVLGVLTLFSPVAVCL